VGLTTRQKPHASWAQEQNRHAGSEGTDLVVPADQTAEQGDLLKYSVLRRYCEALTVSITGRAFVDPIIEISSNIAYLGCVKKAQRRCI
jgi:hypothetical protein